MPGIGNNGIHFLRTKVLIVTLFMKTIERIEQQLAKPIEPELDEPKHGSSRQSLNTWLGTDSR